jgi:hypothetical protein
MAITDFGVNARKMVIRTANVDVRGLRIVTAGAAAYKPSNG